MQSNITGFEEELRNQMVMEEERRATINTLQSGAYGAGQAFELEMHSDKEAKVVTSNNIADEVRLFLSGREDLHRLQINRIGNAVELVGRFPDSYRAWVNLAACHTNGGDIVEAKKAIRKAIELAPDADSVKAMRGRVMILEGKAKEALEIYKELLSQRENIAARETIAMLEMVLGNVDGAIEELKMALEKDKKKRASLYYNLGVAHLVKRKSGRAISYFRKALEADSRYKIAYGGIGVGYSLMGQYGKAERMFRIASNVESLDPGAKLNLARTLAMARKWDTMIRVLVDLVKEFPRHWQAREALGRAYINVGKIKEAGVQFRRILAAIESKEYNGDLSNGLNNLGVTRFFSREYKDAEERLLESVKVSDRKNTKALANLARVYLMTKREEKADILLNEIRNRFGNENIDVLHLEISYYYRTEKYDESINAARKLIAMDPKNIFASFSLAALLADVYDDYKQAENVLRRIPEEDKMNTAFINNLAYILALSGKTKEAEELIEKAEPRNPISEAVLMATKGLIRIRQGDIARGAAFYNAAARIVSDMEFKTLILQKKELELGRWYLGGDKERIAQNHLLKAIRMETKDKIYERKAKELSEII